MADKFIDNKISPSDNWTEVLNKFCHSLENEMWIDYAIFKLVASKSTYSDILTHLYKTIQDISLNGSKATIYLSMKSLTVGDLDKHRSFIFDTIKKLSEELPDTLEICYCYKTPFVFAQVYNMISVAIDKETRQKVKIVKN
jgi:hypothetical protein